MINRLIKLVNYPRTIYNAAFPSIRYDIQELIID